MEESTYPKDFTKEEKTIATFTDRKELYEKTIAEKSELSIEENSDKINLEVETKQEFIQDKIEINNILKLIKREKIILKISNGDKEFNTKIILLKNEGVQIINSFGLYGEMQFPENAKCSFNLEGSEYIFNLKLKEKVNEELVLCEYPKEVNILKRRNSHRIKAIEDINVGVYWPLKQKEFLGSIIDVSTIGIRLKFDYEIFDMELFTILNSKKSEELVILFESNNDFFALNIKVKHIKINEKNNTIEIGTEFIYTHELKLDMVEKLILDLDKNFLKYKKDKNSIMLIESSKKGIILND